MPTETFLIYFFIIIHLTAVLLLAHCVSNKRHNFLAELQTVRKWIMQQECLRRFKSLIWSLLAFESFVWTKVLLNMNFKQFTAPFKSLRGLWIETSWATSALLPAVQCDEEITLVCSFTKAEFIYEWINIWLSNKPLLINMLVFVHSLGCNEKHSSCHFNQTKGYWSVPNYSHRFSTETLYCILKDAGCTVSQPTQHNPTKQNWV